MIRGIRYGARFGAAWDMIKSVWDMVRWREIRGMGYDKIKDTDSDIDSWLCIERAVGLDVPWGLKQHAYWHHCHMNATAKHWSNTYVVFVPAAFPAAWVTETLWGTINL